MDLTGLYLLVALLALFLAYIIFKKPLFQLWEVRACPSYQMEGAEKLVFEGKEQEVRMLILGDIGSGSDNQKRVAQSSFKTCQEQGCDLVLIAGDNFIQKGIQCINDPQLETKFEKMYSLQVPFYAVLGNHDLKGNWRAQIDYTRHSSRWNLPGTNYRLAAGPVQIDAVNTTCSMRTLWRLFKRTNKSWHLVLGHHPVVSGGRHGGMTWLERWIVAAAGIDFFVSGHNHVLEHLTYRGFDQIVSGGGGSPIQKSSRNRLSGTQFYLEEFGYVWAYFNGKEACFQYYDINGKERYSFTKTRK